MYNQPWTSSELLYLNTAITCGLSDKVIATILGRTPQAVSKKLRRQGLRGEDKKSYSKVNRIRLANNCDLHSPSNGSTDILNPQLIANAPNSLSEGNFSDYTLPRPPAWARTLGARKNRACNEVWVDIGKVLKFLREQGVKCYYDFNKPDAMHICADRHMTNSQILLYANRLRVEQGEKPFCVSSITDAGVA